MEFCCEYLHRRMMNRLSSKLATAGEDQLDYFNSHSPSVRLMPKAKSPRDLVPQVEIFTKRPQKMHPQWSIIINLLQYGIVALVLVAILVIMVYAFGVVSREIYIISNRTKPIESLLEQILRNQDRESESCQPSGIQY